MEDGNFTSHDTDATEIQGPMCRECGHRGGQHRPQIGTHKPACKGPAYDPADVAIFAGANPDADLSPYEV